MRWPTALARRAARVRWLLPPRLVREARGAQTVEYALLIFLVVVVLVTAIEALFGSISDLIDRVREDIGQLGGGTP